MVLDGDQPEVVVGPLDRLDAPVLGPAEATSLSTEPTDGLVVGGVDGAGRALRDLASRLPSSKRSSCARTVRSAGPRWSTGAGGKVLDQRPAECDVDHLQAPAHAEDRDPSLDAPGESCVLQRVARLVDHRRGMDRLAPQRRVRVGSPGSTRPSTLGEERVVERGCPTAETSRSAGAWHGQGLEDRAPDAELAGVAGEVVARA